MSRRDTLACAIALAIVTSSCIPWLRVRVKEGDPPEFHVCGTPSTFFQRRVERLQVYGWPSFSGPPGELLWEVQAVGDARSLTRVDYGAVPEGFTQTVPPAGSVAPSLRADWRYAVRVQGSGVGRARFDWRGVSGARPMGLERVM
jgi:hypothetical protein